MPQTSSTPVVLKWVYAICKYYPWNCVGFTLIRVIGFTGLGILPGFIIKYFFDDISKGALTYHQLLIYVGGLLLVPVAQTLSYYADIALSYGWVELVRAILRRNIFRHILRQPAGMELPVSRGQLLHTIRNDINTPIEWVWDIPYFLAYGTFSLCGLFILGSIDWLITIVLMSPLIFLVLFLNQMKKRIERLFIQQQTATDKVTQILSDIFSYACMIKNNNAQNHFLQRFHKLNEERTKKAIYNDTFDTFLNSIYSNMSYLGTGFLLLLISRKMYEQTLTVGEFYVFIYFLSYVSNLTRLLGKAFTGWKRTAVSYERMKQIIPENTFATVTEKGDFSLEDDEETTDASERIENLTRLDVNNLTYEYPNSVKGIRNISFSLEKGSFTVISGKMGSGKTTLLKVLLGLLPESQGEVQWNHQRMIWRDRIMIPPRVAYIPQEPHLFSGTLQDNILLGKSVSPEKLAEAIHLAVFEEDWTTFIDPMNTEVGIGGVKLSGGQKKRIAAARMFVRDADLWVLDDVSSALDVATEQELWSRVHAHIKKHKITCLVVSNKTYAQQYADQIIWLENGERTTVRDSQITV